MTGPDQPEGEQPRPEDSRTRGRRHQDAYDFGRQLRELRNEVDNLRDRVHDVSGRERTDRDNLSETTGYVAELLPRMREVEDQLAALLAANPTAGAGPDRAGAASDGSGANASGTEDSAVPTPAVGWDQMNRAGAAAAWQALAEFVSEVLHRQYRLTRLQVPDCWPLHPRMVRELAWLRSSYLEAGDAEPDVPAASAPWHTRSLPLFFANTTDAVDRRECRPGVHRLTEPEVDHYVAALTAARQAGQPDPEPSTKTGVDRPRLRPEHFPTRSTSTARRGTTASPVATIARPPKPEALEDLLIDSCRPDYWLGYYDDARAADLAHRSD